jgi:hypothetical protein
MNRSHPTIAALSSPIRSATVAFVAVLVGISAASIPTAAQSERAEYDLEGTWAVQVTPYNCATGAPSPVFFYGVAAYHRGGTAPGINAGQATSAPSTTAVGKWVSTGGRTYTLTTITFVLWGQGVQAWSQRITMRITMTDRDNFTGQTSADFSVVPGPLPPPSVPVPPPACARTVGFRYP